MVKFVRVSVCLVTVFGLAIASHASVLFFDDFNSEHGGAGVLNFDSFSKGWTVTSGTVDLIGNGYFDFLAGNGLYIDMDGSTGKAGTLSKRLAFENGVRYTLSFDLAGDHREGHDGVNVTIESLLNTHSIEMESNDPFRQIVYSFIGDGNIHALTFGGIGADNIGLLLDNVKVESNVPVPEPISMLLFGTGLVGLGVVGQRKLRQANH